MAVQMVARDGDSFLGRDLFVSGFLAESGEGAEVAAASGAGELTASDGGGFPFPPAGHIAGLGMDAAAADRNPEGQSGGAAFGAVDDVAVRWFVDCRLFGGVDWHHRSVEPVVLVGARSAFDGLVERLGE